MGTKAPAKTKLSSRVALVISMCLVLLGSGLAQAVQTGFGSIDVDHLRFAGKNGAVVQADIFRPHTATEKTPAPMVLVSPGFQRTKETQISNSLELARRGIVTVVVDPYNQGESTSQAADDKDSAISVALDSIAGNPQFNYIDESKIGITGHSAGGSAVRRLSEKWGKKVEKALDEAADPSSPGGTTITDDERAKAEAKDPIRSVYISGWLRNLDDKSFKNSHSNMGLAYARYDEGGYRNINKDGDLRDAPEAVAFINSGLPKKERVGSVVPGQDYGDLENKTYRIANNDNTIHPFQPLSPAAISSLLTFFSTTLDWHTDLSPMNQLWWLKEVGNLIALVGAFMMLFAVARMLLQTSFFAPVVRANPVLQTRPTGGRKVELWVSFVVMAAIAFMSFIPLANLTEAVFPDATNAVNTWFFPGKMVNAVLLWSLFNGLIGLLWFFVSGKLAKRRSSATGSVNAANATTNAADGTAVETGAAAGPSAATKSALGISLSALWRTLLLALVLLFVWFSTLALVGAMFSNDYRFLVVAARPLSLRWLRVLIEYVPLLFIFFFTNSLRSNVSLRWEGQNGFWGGLLAALANSIGLAAIFVVQYVTFFKTGTVFWTDDWLYVNMLQSVLPMMFLLPLLHRAFFNISGRVWLGPMVTVVIFAAMLLQGSVIYIPMS